MKRKYCGECKAETWHNPTKAGDLRCVSCGFPKRYGNKNYGLRVAGKIIMEPKKVG